MPQAQKCKNEHYVTVKIIDIADFWPFVSVYNSVYNPISGLVNMPVFCQEYQAQHRLAILNNPHHDVTPVKPQAQKGQLFIEEWLTVVFFWMRGFSWSNCFSFTGWKFADMSVIYFKLIGSYF